MVFSKFDHKAGFWQFGVLHTDKYKAAFCIPQHHFKWTVIPFGLKIASSLLQKAMPKIFQPILHTTLVYIDDILHFSEDESQHFTLLEQLYQIVHNHGIVLSKKKIILGVNQIDFLGMHLENDSYQPQLHLTLEIQKFPDTNLTQKQIRQFLRFVNYIGDFIPNLSKYTTLLSKMLRKDAPSWSSEQTTVVKILKNLTQDLPPLQIPSQGRRILQTDASDEFWGAMLIEEQSDGSRRICGYKSGKFDNS